MNWIEKRQDGGTVSPEEATQEQQLNTLAAAMIQLLQLQTAEELGDEEATALLAEVQKRAQLMAQGAAGGTLFAKCGAKLKKKACGGTKLACGGIAKDKCGKKLKKAACGKKLSLGGKPALAAKGGCPCKHIMRQGGKLITVDCEGNIIK